MLLRSKGETKTPGECSGASRGKICTGSGRMDRKTPNIFHVLTNIIRAKEWQRLGSAIRAADIVITPDLSDMGTFAIHKRDEATRQGYMAAKAILPQLQAIIHRPSLELLTPVV